MKDRIVEHPNRYSLEPVDAAEGVVDLIPFPGYVTEPGTPLNKGTLLSDETAAALGLAGDPTVDEALNAIGGALALGVQIATGSYVGTGTFGESNPNVLTFDFEPYAVFVFSDNYQVAETFQETAWSSGGWRSVFSFSLISFFRGGSSVEVAAMRPKDLNGNLGQTITNMPYTMEGNTVSWKYTNTYGSDSLKARVQLNVSGTAYHYIAIGKGGGL